MLLSTDIWVAALIRRAEQGGGFATVMRKGDAPRRRGAFGQGAGPAGGGGGALCRSDPRGWRAGCGCSPTPAPREAALDAYAERARRIDPDLWLVEIDDNQGRHFLTETVEG